MSSNHQNLPSEQLSKRCVFCGSLVTSLFTQYGPGNFVLEQCVKCKSFVDPYIDQSWMICLIDLFLLKPSVYRHIIFNLNYPIIDLIRFGSSTLILESFFLTLDEFSQNHPDSIKGFFLFEILKRLIGLLINFIGISLTSLTLNLLRKRGREVVVVVDDDDDDEGAERRRSEGLRKFYNLMMGLTLALLPGQVLQMLVMIFKDSFGSLQPHLKQSSIIRNLRSILLRSERSWFRIIFPDEDRIGIDMDQLGSKELKQFLIRSLIGGLSMITSVSVVLYTRSWFGLLVLVVWNTLKNIVLST